MELHSKPWDIEISYGSDSFYYNLLISKDGNAITNNYLWSFLVYSLEHPRLFKGLI